MKKTKREEGRGSHTKKKIYSRNCHKVTSTNIEALLDSGGNLSLVLMTLMDVEIVTDTDNLSKERDHVGGFTDSLTMRDLGLSLIKVVDGKAKELASGSERETS